MNALLTLYVYVKNLFEVEEGQDLIEYALIIGLVVLVVVAVMGALGSGIAAQFTGITSTLGGS